MQDRETIEVPDRLIHYMAATMQALQTRPPAARLGGLASIATDLSDELDVLADMLETLIDDDTGDGDLLRNLVDQTRHHIHVTSALLFAADMELRDFMAVLAAPDAPQNPAVKDGDPEANEPEPAEVPA